MEGDNTVKVDFAKVTGKELKAITGFNLIINISKELESLKKDLKTLDVIDLGDSQVPMKVKQLIAIMGTAGNSIANQFFINKINELDFEIDKRFPYIPLIKRKMEEVSAAFNISVGKHFQGYERIKQLSVVKALGGGSLLDEPSVTINRNKRRDGDVIESD